jgi:endonuclease/exonuclease/phosphatase family metal-dependent hydrolase
MKKTLTCALFFVLFSLNSFSSLPFERPLNTLKIGAFNIQVFGRSKMQLPPTTGKISEKVLKKWKKRKHVVPTLIKIVKRYDVLLIQEIREKKIPTELRPHYQTAIKTLLNEVNQDLPRGKRYRITIGERLGRRSGNTKEQYAYLYREDKLEVIEDVQYKNVFSKTTFARPPYVVRFRSLRNKNFDFALIGLHSEPEKAFEEVKELSDVFDYVKELWGEEDTLILGDLNSSCEYIENQSVSDLEDLLNDHPERYDLEIFRSYTHDELRVMFPKYKYQWNPLAGQFKWHIGNYVKTTVGTITHCAYDRLISTGDVTDKVVHGSAKAFHFDTKFFPKESKIIRQFILKDRKRLVAKKKNKRLKAYKKTKAERIAIQRMRDISDHYPVELILKVR